MYAVALNSPKATAYIVKVMALRHEVPHAMFVGIVKAVPLVLVADILKKVEIRAGESLRSIQLKLVHRYDEMGGGA
jgi:hypothetical protein